MFWLGVSFFSRSQNISLFTMPRRPCESPAEAAARIAAQKEARERAASPAAVQAHERDMEIMRKLKADERRMKEIAQAAQDKVWREVQRNTECDQVGWIESQCARRTEM